MRLTVGMSTTTAFLTMYSISLLTTVDTDATPKPERICCEIADATIS